MPYVVPRILQIFERLHLKATVFVVGRDALQIENRESLQSIVAAGHELGNHSFEHQPWLQRYGVDALEAEFDRAEAALGRITDAKIAGFRGPGFSLSSDVLELLAKRGYRYDGSTFPTFLGPAARAYYMMRSSFSKQEKSDRAPNYLAAFQPAFVR
ncbi:MAG: polysaccharide deacetylase family protein [Pirellulaceae bacterium]